MNGFKKLQEHWSRTELPYFIAVSIITILLLYTGITHGIQENPDDVRKRMYQSSKKICSEQYNQEYCRMHARLFLRLDLKEDIIAMQKGDPEARDRMHLKLNQQVDYTILSNPSMYRKHCLHIHSDKVSQNEYMKPMCRCMSVELENPLKNLINQTFKTNKEFMVQIKHITEKAKEICMKKLKS